MPITNYHPEYNHWHGEWKKCRDAYDGQTAVKKGGIAYLPKLSDQSDEDYKAYKDRALYYSITSKSVSGMVGMATVKPPVLKYPRQMAHYFEESSGIQFWEMFFASVSENLIMGRYGVLIDRPLNGGAPKLRGYRAEDILNWRLDFEGNPTLIVLRELLYEDVTDDKYEQNCTYVYRELELVNGEYRQTVYNEKGEIVTTIVPTNTGKPMDFLPFYIVNPFGVGFGTTKPPILDIVEINLSHYRSSADLEHGRHFTGLPTPVVIGVATDTKLKIGSMTAWVLPDKDADAKFLEFTGVGLQSLEKALSEKESQLASLSARLLDSGKNGSEAADAVRLRYMSETASLSSILRATEAFLNLMFKCIAIMEDLNQSEVSIILDKEILSTRLTSNDILKLTESFLQGGMTAETYVFNLRRGDAIAADRSDEEEIKAANEARQLVIDTAKSAATAATKQPGGGA